MKKPRFSAQCEHAHGKVGRSHEPDLGADTTHTVRLFGIRSIDHLSKLQAKAWKDTELEARSYNKDGEARTTTFARWSQVVHISIILIQETFNFTAMHQLSTTALAQLEKVRIKGW